jgi:hypothetical protein
MMNKASIVPAMLCGAMRRCRPWLLRCRLLAAGLLVLNMATVPAQPLQIELVVRTIDNFKTPDDVAVFFARAKKAHVAIVHVNVKQDEDDERPSGQVFYASAIAPVAAGYEKFDALAASITEAHKRGIKVYAWLPQFHDQAALRAHPEWQTRASGRGHSRSRADAGKNAAEYFANPIDPAVQAYEMSLIVEVVRNYQVDGISLDRLRFDDINMESGPVTRRLAALTGLKPGRDPMLLNFPARSLVLQRWQSWRTQKVALYVAQVRLAVMEIRPETRLTAFFLPPQFTEVGQDLALFSLYLDEVHPMAYFKDWSYSPAWIAARLMADVEQKRVGKAAVKPTLDGSDTFAQNVGILSAVEKKFPDVGAIAWFTAGYWQPAEIDRIVNIHRAAAAAHH